MRAKKGKRKKKEDSGEAREFSVGRISVRRRGKNVEWINNASPQQFAAMRAARAKWKSKAPAEFRREAEDVIAAVRHVDPLTVLGVVFFDRHLGPLLAGKPMDDSYAVVEHIALLLAKDQPNRSDGQGEQFVLDQAAGDVLERYLKAHLQEALQFAFPDPAEEGFEGSDALAECIVNVVGWEMTVRMPRYDHQQKALLRSLLDPFADPFRARLGFSCADAMVVENVFVRRLQDTALQGAELARESLRKVRRALCGANVDEADAAFADMLCERSPQDPMAYALVAMGAWLGFRTGHSMSMTAEDVELETGLDGTRVAHILAALTTTNSDLDDYAYIVPMSPLKRKPLVQICDSYVMPSPALFLPALQTLFEDDLKDSTYWHAYEDHRKEFSERRAAELISRVLPGAVVVRNLKYPNGELDVLVEFDRRLLLIEVKGGGFAARSRVGIGKLLEANLRDLVSKAHEQSRRAANYINSADEVTFKTDGGALVLRRGDVDRVYRVAVTLEQIGHVVNGFGSIIAANPKDVSWTVALDDLETITDVLVRPAQFFHYLDRRETILAAPHVEGQDELGFLEWYLHTCLRVVPAIYQDAPRIMMDATSNDVDAFEQAKGQGQNPAPPAQDVPAQVMLLVDRLAASRFRGWLDAGIALLALPHRLQRSLARQMQKIDRGGGKTEIHVVPENTVGGVTVRIGEREAAGRGPAGWLFVVDRSWRVLQIHYDAG